MYKLTNGKHVVRLTDNATIPADEFNSDYIVYLQWVGEGNSPAPVLSEDDQLVLDSVEGRKQRDVELARADIQLLKVEDGAQGMGTQKAWRDYRNALRGWPDTDSFPATMPTAPDAK